MQNIKFTSFHPFMKFRRNFNDISMTMTLKCRKAPMPKEIYRNVPSKKGIFASKKFLKELNYLKLFWPRTK